MRPMLDPANTVLTDWSTAPDECERCAGTFGRTERTPAGVLIFRCWCGKIKRVASTTNTTVQ